MIEISMTDENLRIFFFFLHSTVILREYFQNITSKFCNIARIFLKVLEKFLKYCNIMNKMLLRY